MDQIISVLFNTNHEAPSLWVVVFLAVLALGFPLLTNYAQRNRTQKRPGQNDTPRKKDRKK